MVSCSSRRRGTSLLLALMALFVVSAAVAAVHDALSRDHGSLRSEEVRTTLLALDDAALAATLARVAAGLAAAVPATRLGDGTYASRVEAAPDGRLVVLTRSTFRGRTSSARAVVEARGSRPRVVSWERGPAAR